MNERSRMSRLLYDALVAGVGGAALGWFGWWFLDGHGTDSTLPLIAWVAIGIALAFGLARWLRARSATGRSRWVHLLWIPAVVLVLLMVAVVLALRSFQ